MNKNFVLFSALTLSSSFIHADDISNPAGDGSSIDLFQVANTVSTGGSVDITSVETNQVNVVVGNAVDNVIAISQQGSLSTATIVVNAQLPDDPNTGVGSRLTAKVADISLATAGAVGSINDASTTDGGSGNAINLAQNGAGSVFNTSVDGSLNQVTVTQNVDGGVINLPLNAVGLVVNVTQ